MKASQAALVATGMAIMIVAVTYFTRDQVASRDVAAVAEAGAAAAVADPALPGTGRARPIGDRYVEPGSLRMDPDALSAADQRLAAAATRKYEAIYAADKADAVKGSQTEQTLVSAIQSPALREVPSQPLDYNVGCKSSMCRIESTFLANDEANEWATRLQLRMGGEFGATSTVFTPGAEGRKKVVIYAFRLGREPKA